MSWLRKLAQRVTMPDLLQEERNDNSQPAAESGAERIQSGGPHIDLLCGDPAAHEWASRLNRGDWSDFGDFLRSQSDYEVRDFYVRVLGDALGKWPAWLDTWVSEQPNDAMARLFRGMCYVHYAWDARGSDSASKVKHDSWPLFFQRLQAAEADLTVASDLAPDDPGPWVVMLTTARGLQFGIPEVRRRYAEVERRHPLHVAACSQVLQAVAQKWGGSHEMMFEFARSVCSRAPLGSPAQMLIAEAHYEEWLQLDDKNGFWEQKAVREEVVQAVSNALTDHVTRPTTVALRNSAAFYFWFLDERALMREQFDAIGNVICGAWTNFADPTRFWVGARNLAYSSAAQSC